MENQISFGDFESYIGEEEYTESIKIAYNVFSKVLKFNSKNFAFKAIVLDEFFEESRLGMQWHTEPYKTIEALCTGRLGKYKGHRLLFWLFLTHPEKCEELADALWGCSSLADHHKNELLKKNSASQLPLNNTDRVSFSTKSTVSRASVGKATSKIAAYADQISKPGKEARVQDNSSQQSTFVWKLNCQNSEGETASAFFDLDLEVGGQGKDASVPANVFASV